MWNIVNVFLIIFEISILSWFVFSKFQKRKVNDTIIFLVLVFISNLIVCLLPFLYSVVAKHEEYNYVIETLVCVKQAIELYIGGINVDIATTFSKDVSLYTYSYALGVILAMLGTISAAIEAFSTRIANYYRVNKKLKNSECDIVLGSSDLALKYAKKNNGLVLVDNNINKEKYLGLIDEGYTVLKKDFNNELFTKYLNRDNKYNIICLKENDNFLNIIETYINYIKNNDNKTLKLYVELENSKIETIKKEVIEKNKAEEHIEIFSTDELLSREFIEEHPVTEYLPLEFIDDDASIKSDKTINVFFVGFHGLSEKLYNYYVMNNQLVTFKDNEYKVLPINYFIYEDRNDKSSEYTITGLKEELKNLDKNEYFTIPDLPCNTNYYEVAYNSRDVLNNIKDKLNNPNSFTYIIIDTLDMYQNLEMGSNFKIWLSKYSNYHLYVRSDKKFVQDDEILSYFGNEENIYSHDVIVNDGLMIMAKKMNEVYTMQSLKNHKQDIDYYEKVKIMSEASWKSFDYFTIQSNMFQSLGLRLKLNLLKLDYIKNNSCDNIDLIDQKYPFSNENEYNNYFNKNIKNSLLAQEHARWNAYHLFNKFLPLKKSDIKIKKIEQDKVLFIIKDMGVKKHSCLTTFKGLDELSNYLSAIASKELNQKVDPSIYDYYKYDESILLNSKDLLEILKYSIKEK